MGFESADGRAFPAPVIPPFAARGRILLLLAPAWALAAEPRDPAKLVAEHCVTCHNQNLVGSPAPNLVDPLWTHGGSDEAILRNIRQGFPQSGMPGYEGVLTEAEMRGIIRHIRSLAPEYSAGRITHPRPPALLPLATELHPARLETWIEGVETPWGIEFLPDGRLLVTEREGRLRIIRDGKLDPAAVRGLPKALVKQDGGLLDVIAHPRFAENGWIYLAYVETGRDPATSMTVVVRGRIRDGAWVDQQDIFRGPPESYVKGWIHYGCRFLFDREERLFFTIGERGVPEAAQDLASPLGKIHRVLDDGRIPPDNPFVGRANAHPEIYALGFRDIQGIAIHPRTGKVWTSEHGPRGGDEINAVDLGESKSEGIECTTAVSGVRLRAQLSPRTSNSDSIRARMKFRHRHSSGSDDSINLSQNGKLNSSIFCDFYLAIIKGIIFPFYCCVDLLFILSNFAILKLFFTQKRLRM